MGPLRKSRVTDDARRVALLAVSEDGPRDLTSMVTVAPGTSGVARIEYRDGGVLAGVDYADAVAEVCGCGPIRWRTHEGERVVAGGSAGTLSGPLAPIFRAERTLLNVLQRASGIATLTRRYVDAVAGTACRILHTRKTTPGLRTFEVAAVVAGGGHIHRMNLSDIVMVKDNHWRALERDGVQLADALRSARAQGAAGCYVEVETPAQLELACAASASRLLVDNQSPETVRAWGERARQLAPGIEIEASGGITLDNVRSYALALVDFVSVGALTHSVRAADVALEVV